MHKKIALCISILLLSACAPVIERYYKPIGQGTILRSNCMGPEDEFVVFKHNKEKLILSLQVTWGENELLKIWLPRQYRNKIDWNELIIKIKNIENNEVEEFTNLKVSDKGGTNYPALDLVTKYDLYEIEFPINAKDFKLKLQNIKVNDKAYTIPAVKITKDIGFFIYGLCG